jgi:hypothetical protein
MDISLPTTSNCTCNLEGDIACAFPHCILYDTIGETESGSIADNQLNINASILQQAIKIISNPTYLEGGENSALAISRQAYLSRLNIDGK